MLLEQMELLTQEIGKGETEKQKLTKFLNQIMEL
jgi:hypothetical protein